MFAVDYSGRVRIARLTLRILILGVFILISVVVQPWISCPGNIIQDLAPGQGTADVSAVWKLPTSNVQQITINPPEISNSYRFPPGMTKVDWTATNSAGSASCAMYVIISGK